MTSIESKREHFKVACKQDTDSQVELFLKSFIFALGNEWKEVIRLAGEFKKYCREGGNDSMDLNPVQASSFLQKYGLTRTAAQRSQELKDIDLDHDNRISFLEYMLLHYKAMILQEYYKRMGSVPVEDLSNGAIGVVGVGDQLVDELFDIKKAIDPEVEKAIEDLTKRKQERERRINDLTTKVQLGGVKGLAAQNELEQMKVEDPTEMNRLEITLNAAKRSSKKTSGEIAVAAKKQREEQDSKQKLAESRARLAERAAMFNK